MGVLGEQVGGLTAVSGPLLLGNLWSCCYLLICLRALRLRICHSSGARWTWKVDPDRRCILASAKDAKQLKTQLGKSTEVGVTKCYKIGGWLIRHIVSQRLEGQMFKVQAQEIATGKGLFFLHRLFLFPCMEKENNRTSSPLAHCFIMRELILFMRLQSHEAKGSVSQCYHFVGA